MRKLFILALGFLLLAVWIGSSPAVTVTGKKGDAVIKIETDMYRVHWKTAAQMGYVTAFAKKGKDELQIINGDGEGRRFYHSANYNSWKDWGALIDFAIVEQKGGIAKVKFVSDDGDRKEYTCIATFWDGSPLVKHEVTVKAKNDVVSFSDGHEPQYEIRGPSKGMKMWASKGNSGPFAHNAFWTSDAFSALYATDPAVTASAENAWANGLGAGRMQLAHDALGKQLKKGDVSNPIVYWVAFGVGGEKEADTLADEILKGDPKGLAVDARGKLSTTWGAIKDIR